MKKWQVQRYCMVSVVTGFGWSTFLWKHTAFNIPSDTGNWGRFSKESFSMLFPIHNPKAKIPFHQMFIHKFHVDLYAIYSITSSHYKERNLHMSCFAPCFAWLKSAVPQRHSGILFTGTGTSFAQPQLRCVIGGEGGELGCVSCNWAEGQKLLGNCLEIRTLFLIGFAVTVYYIMLVGRCRNYMQKIW